MKNYRIKEYNAIPKSGQRCPFDGVFDGENFQFTQAGALLGFGIPSNLFTSEGLNSFAAGDGSFIKLSITAGAQNAFESCEIIVENSASPPMEVNLDSPPSSFKIDLWAIAGGNAIRIFGCGNVIAEVSEPLVVEKPDPQCLEDPFERYYSWSVFAD